ncbi:MAG: ATP-binding cassette domain-containing protein, partial [Devosia sp.]|nr:ATP-binding cassette domain-containing protein [Devosia sp.]
MTGVLEAVDVCKSFTVRRDGQTRVVKAVNHVSVAVQPGEIVGLVGESGSGKTTIARIMIGIEQASSGRVLYEGRPL